MEITCQNCNAQIKVPDQKVPKDQPFAFKCPSCQGRIIVEPSQSSGASGDLPKSEIHTPPAGIAPMKVMDIGKRTAMICHTKPDPLKRLAHEFGYQAYLPGDHVTAIKSLRFNEYNMVICSSEFERIPHDRATILQTLQRLGMEKRRKMFVIFIGEDHSSFDRMTAFAMSVNLFIAKSDFENNLNKLMAPIKNELGEHELNYFIFNKTLTVIGGA